MSPRLAFRVPLLLTVLGITGLMALPTGVLAPVGPLSTEASGGPRTPHATHENPSTPSSIRTATPIQHVIVIIQENHGTDNYFNQFPGAFGLPPGGVPQPANQSGIQYYGNQYTLGWNYSGNQSSGDPAHGVENIDRNIDNGTMDGYMYTDSQTSNGIYPSYIVPNELGLAQEYGFADQYFHAYAGPTLPNRFYDYAITSGSVLDNSGPSNGSNLVYFNSLPQELQSSGVSWASFDGSYNSGSSVYACWMGVVGYFPPNPCWYFDTTLSQLMPMLYFNWIQNGSLSDLQPWSNLYSDLYTNNLPSVSWYTQDYLNGTEHPGTIAGFGGNVTNGQAGLDGVVRAVENSPYWNSTAIFLTYDEGGGFFDHVPPPSVTGLGDGIRIPLVVISPWAKEGYVSQTYYTPSSLLHFIEWNWNLPALGSLDGISNLPLDFFNFSAPQPRPPLPQSDWGLPNELTAFPWPQQPPSVGLGGGSYTPALISGGNLSWAIPTQNSQLASPTATSDGTRLYVAGMDGILRALDPFTGQELWSDALGTASRTPTALLPGDGVIATTLRGTIVAYSSSNTLLWNLSVGAPIYSGLTTVQGTYYGATTNGSVFAVSENGTLLWWHQVTKDRVYAPLAYDPSDSLLILGTANPSGGDVIGVDLSGSVHWTSPVPGGIFGGGAVASGTYYATTTSGGVYPVVTSSGVVGTPAALPGSSVTAPLIDGSTLIAGNETGFLQAYALPSLTTSWSASLWGDIAGTPAVSGNNIWVGTGAGYLYEIPAAGGTPIQVLHSGTSFYRGPTVVPGGLYITAEDGEVYGWVHPGWVAGTVTNVSSGAPISGASVLFTTPRGPVTATTGAGGNFNASLPGGSYAFFLNVSGYLPKTGSTSVTPSQTTTLNVALTPSGIHPGFADVRLAPTNAILSVNGTAQPIAAGGTYSLSLIPGPYVLAATATGYNPQSTTIAVRSYLTTFWNATLQPVGGAHPGWAAGVITNSSTGAPLSAVNVLLRSAAGPVAATSGTSGAYNVSLNPGSYSVFANSTGYHPFWGNATVSASSTTTLNIPLVPVPRVVQPGVVSGTVYGGSAASGNGLSLIHLYFFPGGEATISSTGGIYSISLPAGTYSVFVNATNYQPYATNGIVVTSGGTTSQNVVLLSVACTAGSNLCNAHKAGTNVTAINWVLWALVVAAVAAALLMLAVVVRRGKRGPPAAVPTEAESMSEEAGAGAMVGTTQALPPTADERVYSEQLVSGLNDPSNDEPPPDSDAI
ncbi:MAG: carboxypeptidase regulatory-like domain-containing protein [Euryarchaeota archaeon]|nr:carboxypeptidase regulatory-like domain-containing protein [Euryarchaeota archaeon]